ncbi:hypothetical protein LOC68_18540 [Blastopirellula sp. JC732]|uniref:Uncharacterized protein n=1 Tax=Blastopirellula sediminis TaxID=2894196 RepID=A0A9X1MQW7_9BACT|nr:hypothetical protein [Blastopirellula sediminis]MCC9606305.1 hypothetical protein [Blastopirellula sediminis]MCC9630397.1 hypothetical protein [Blastopirellula sediminis]
MKILRGPGNWKIVNLPQDFRPEVLLAFQMACEECFRRDEYQLTSGHLVLGLIKGTYLRSAECTADEWLRKGRLAIETLSARDSDPEAPERRDLDSRNDYLIYITTAAQQGLRWLQNDSPATPDAEDCSPNLERFLTQTRASAECEGARVLAKLFPVSA